MLKVVFLKVDGVDLDSDGGDVLGGEGQLHSFFLPVHLFVSGAEGQQFLFFNCIELGNGEEIVNIGDVLLQPSCEFDLGLYYQ
jgi:hypothetical protein